MKFLLLLAILHTGGQFFCLNALGAATVRAYDIESIEVYASTDTVPTMSMVVEAPSSSGIGNAESAPITAYIPTNGTGDQSKQTVISDSSKLPERVGIGNAFIMIRLLLSNDSDEDLFLNVAVKDGSDYESFVLSTSDDGRVVSAGDDSQEAYAIFSLDNLCEQTSSSDLCSSSTNDEIQDDLNLYFYLDDSKEANSSVTTSENGLFLELKISNKLPENTYTFSSLDKGDDKLVANLAEGDDITQMGDDIYLTYVFRYTGTTEQSAQTVGDAISSGSVFKTDSPITEGEFGISDLTNGESYNLSFALVNKYQFASILSSSKVQSPEDIEAFLNSQACYLLSAGFGKRHYVIDYFRGIRDEYLLRFGVGEQFVNWYYETAPQYAGYIYRSKILSAIIRFGGYTAYFIFIYGPYLIMFLALGMIIALFRKRKSLSI